MKNRKHAGILLEELPIKPSDAARLVLEAVEEMPELRAAAAQGRDALMRALRRVQREGIATVREQEKNGQLCLCRSGKSGTARTGGAAPDYLAGFALLREAPVAGSRLGGTPLAGYPHGRV